MIYHIMYMWTFILQYILYIQTWPHTHVATNTHIAGNFRGGGGGGGGVCVCANFRYFRDYPTSHEIFHPRNFPPTNFQSVIAYWASGVTKFLTTKINSEDPRQLFTKICTPENYPLYGNTKTLLLNGQYIHMHIYNYYS